jgi:hypothetical protein
MQFSHPAAQRLDGEAWELLKWGYSRVLWVHVHCATHGVYRLGLGQEQEQYLCPVCQQACKMTVLAEGFTKQPLPFAPVLIDAPLPRWWVARIGADLEGIERLPQRRTSDKHHRHKIRAVTAAAMAGN